MIENMPKRHAASFIAHTHNPNSGLVKWLDNFVSVYQQLNIDNLHLLADIYDDDICFIDPLHQVNGLTELSRYFENLYCNVNDCQFSIDQVINQQDKAALYWTMSFKHKRLNNGNLITVEGHSLLKMRNNKVVYHRDYIDVGAMLYEHIPVVGRVITWLKNRAAK